MLLKNHNKAEAIMGRAQVALGLLALAALALLPYGASLAASPAAPAEMFASAPASPDFLQQDAEGTIAYVNQNETEIWLIEPDGSNKRRLWSMPPQEEFSIDAITGLSWRPDSSALAFASTHEKYCSWYNSDIYTIFPDGSGLRRITNAPQCAALASYPKGAVTVTLQNNTFNSGLIGVLIQGSAELELVSLSPFGSVQVTFSEVADLGDVVQAVTAVYGGYRYYGAAVADVLPGQTVDAGVLEISGDGFWRMGANKASWRYDGSRIGYTTTNCTPMYQISTSPIDGAIGDPVLNVEDIFPCVMAWGPTAATANQVLYSADNPSDDDNNGIFLATAGGSSPGTRLVSLPSLEGEYIHDIKWLPDGSGFLFTKQHVDFGIMSDIFEYNFASESVSQITNFEDEEYAVNFSISPDGQQIVFEFRLEYDGPTDLYVIDRNGSNMRLLVAGAGHPAWSSGPLQAPVIEYLFLPVLVR